MSGRAGLGLFCLALGLIFLGASSALGVEPVSAEPSRFPSETVTARMVGTLRVLHRDDFSEDTLGRFWGRASRETEIADGVLKVRSEGNGLGKVKVKVEPFVDGELRFRFQYIDAKGFGFGFDDLTATDRSHGGHLIGLNFANGAIVVKDVLTGIYNAEYYEAYKSKQVTDEMKVLFDRCEASAPYAFVQGRWYGVVLTLRGDRLRLALDGREIIDFRSPGIAHPRKDMYRFNVGRGELQMDDVSLVDLAN